VRVLYAPADRSTADDLVERTLAQLVASGSGTEQPPLAGLPDERLTAVLPALALGGAERIVLDWAVRLRGRYPVHLVLLGKARAEYAVPAGVRVTRLDGEPALSELGRSLAASANPVCLCHLLTPAQRAVLRRAGAVPVPVIHNARAGWIDAPDALAREPHVVAVSRACADELRDAGYRGRVSVIRHLPAPRLLDASLRDRFRDAWGIPPSAFVVGMVGGVKPQKAYPRAVRILAALRRRIPDARLVIVGGPVGRDGPLAWNALVAQRARHALEGEVTLAGFVPDAVRCLPAFDVVLNTSRHEGLSIATLEALAAGLPVVASAVGGQGEVEHAGLTLLPFEADENVWAAALDAARAASRAVPAWAGFPAYRQWTLAHLAAPYRPDGHVLLATANLNAGGAQRSLVNLACELVGRLDFSIAVTGNSTSDAFHRELRNGGVDVVRTATSRDAFDHAEALVRLARARRASVLVFWNVDAKVKLLVAKAAEALPALKLVDVSPGGYADDELVATEHFQQLIAYGADDFRRRLDRQVIKFGRGRDVTPNGVRLPPSAKATFGGTRVVMSGRIAPSKFVEEALAAMALVRKRLPRAELHVIGGVEPRHVDYAATVLAGAGDELGRTVFFHGPDAGAPGRLAGYDVALVLGRHQGCPNACLEALAAGVPVVANDSGGTREQVVHGKTGWLVSSAEPTAIAQALVEALTRPDLARLRSLAGRKRVARRFPMARMARAYLRLFAALRRRAG
jgi:glycosyltransferase involved in cell wall biosynthesis